MRAQHRIPEVFFHEVNCMCKKVCSVSDTVEEKGCCGARSKAGRGLSQSTGVLFLPCLVAVSWALGTDPRFEEMDLWGPGRRAPAEVSGHLSEEPTVYLWTTRVAWLAVTSPHGQGESRLQWSTLYKGRGARFSRCFHFCWTFNRTPISHLQIYCFTYETKNESARFLWAGGVLTHFHK